jgi:hypothetical protein
MLATHGETCEFCQKTGVFIEGKEVTLEDIGSPVTYVPRHAKGDASHSDCERGHISSVRDNMIWVRFHAATGANTPPELLVWG